MVSREVMATVLTMTGYTIHTAAQGEEAVSLLESGTCQPEVILMDAQMPGLKGAQLVGELRARSKASIYSMSGSDVPDDLKKAVDGHLSKPFGPQALQQLMEQHHPVAESEAGDVEPVIKPETLAAVSRDDVAGGGTRDLRGGRRRSGQAHRRPAACVGDG